VRLFFGIQAFRKIRDLALEKGWLSNDTDEEDDPYKTLVVATPLWPGGG
jgi:hypothetical protein